MPPSRSSRIVSSPLWTATFALPGGKEGDVPISDFFRVEGGLPKEIRPYFLRP
jgi:hypothetical protein